MAADVKNQLPEGFVPDPQAVPEGFQLDKKLERGDPGYLKGNSNIGDWVMALTQPIHKDAIEPTTAAQIMVPMAMSSEVPMVAKALQGAIKWGAAGAGIHGVGAVLRKLGLK